MTIRSIQKVIKIGSSLAVTIPARDAKAMKLDAGKEVDISVKPIATKQRTTKDINAEYKAFKRQYGETLKNLSQR